MIKKGDEAPDFALTDSEYNVVKLSDFRGKNVVVYFYPKDMTPGCTKEACGFRDYYTYYRDAKAIILGVSMDSESSHKRFIEKYGLPFPLLSDPEGRVCKMYGVHEKKKSGGREYWSVRRVTFLIDPHGRVREVFENVDVSTHHRDVLKLIE